MSAIWGMISKENAIANTVVDKMQNSMKSFKIDCYQNLVQGSVYFACGLQYFTKESHFEQLPLYDETSHTFFTADCVLTNRTEVINMLKNLCTTSDLSSLGDGMLSYKLYQYIGERFVEHLRGSFSFAVYNEENKELLLYADHFAKRYLAYHIDNRGICFSTAYQPLLSVMQTPCRINKRWIASAYTDCSADTIKLHASSVYENIYHVEPGQYVKINIQNNQLEKFTYWNPLNHKIKCSLKTDEEYRSLFLATFRKAVNDLLCVDGKIGIMLSGGLDSSSIAALAALELKKRGELLYSYTAVPIKEYNVQNTSLRIENEKSFILAQQQMHPNISPQFIDSDATNAFTDINAHASCYMEPVKPILNMVNLHGIMQKASDDGCKLMLSGQNGNATISYGSIRTYLYQKLKQYHFGEAYREFHHFCKRHNVSKKYFIKLFLTTYYEEHIKKYKPGDDCFLKKELLLKYNIIAQEREQLKHRGNGCMDTVRQRNGFCFMPLVYQHMGFYDTYGSLRYGILSVDPTLTKEMVELCLNMPMDCFVKNGKERRAIRDYMKGYVPDVILDNYAGRGVQAADYAYRVNRDWHIIQDNVFNLLENPELLEYLDQDKLQGLIDEIRCNQSALDKNAVAKAAIIASLSAFLNQAKQFE